MTDPDDTRKEEEIARAFGREMAVIEAAARALKEALRHVDDNPEAGDLIIEALAALPLIEAAALERAAKLVASAAVRGASDLAADIRALKQRP